MTEKLSKKLSEYGDIHVCKADYVFTLYMTGKGLSNWKTLKKITDQVFNECENVYPNTEVIHSSDEYLLLILKP